MSSRYDDPEYQKQVSLQMLATPTLEIACRAIIDIRQELKDSVGDGSPTIRFDCLMKELEKRFPQPRPYWSSQVPEHFYVEAIDKAIKDSKELNAAKRALLNVFSGGNLFPNKGEEK